MEQFKSRNNWFVKLQILQIRIYHQISSDAYMFYKFSLAGQSHINLKSPKSSS